MGFTSARQRKYVMMRLSIENRAQFEGKPTFNTYPTLARKQLPKKYVLVNLRGGVKQVTPRGKYPKVVVVKAEVVKRKRVQVNSYVK